MIFRAIAIYRKTKQGVNDPMGLVTDEVRDAFMGIVMIPGLILLVVTIILSILSFSYLITAPSILAQVFFWIFTIVLVLYIILVSTIKNLLEKVLKKIENLQNKIPER